MNWDDVIDRLRHGWTKGTLMNAQGEVCLIGAMREIELFNRWSSFDHAKVQRHVAVLAPHIREHFPDRDVRKISDWSACVDFNNHPLTTLDEVIAMCEKARADA